MARQHPLTARVKALSRHGRGLVPQEKRVVAPINWTDHRRAVVFAESIRVAAHEQHGHHMPLHTDSLLLGEIVRRAEARVGGDVLFAPLQWLGNSHHHMDFPGTLSAEPRAYLDLLTGELENFIQHGFKRG